MHGLANQPADPILPTTEVPAVAGPCVARVQAIMSRVLAGTATPDDIAFASAVQANPEQFQYSNGDCSQYSANPLPAPTTSGFSLSDIPWWGWLGLVFVANEVGLFGKNDLQMLDL